MSSFGMCLRGYELMRVPFKLMCTMKRAVNRLDAITKRVSVKKYFTKKNSAKHTFTNMACPKCKQPTVKPNLKNYAQLRHQHLQKKFTITCHNNMCRNFKMKVTMLIISV